ncbi:Nn.00g112550.m01.CDS01 [Neocucurbitaria sp. VM-36]
MHLPQLKITLAVPVMAALILSTPGAQAMPTAVSSVVSGVKSFLPRSIDARGFNGMGPVMLYLAVKDYLKDRNAYDPSVENKCALYMSTTDGGNCATLLNCENDDKSYKRLPDWNVCYLNGNQFFTHPDIGDFSIQYTKAGGVDGNTEDGLHHPIVKFANLNNWEPMDVQAFIDNSEGEHGNLCHKTKTSQGRGIVYECGIPKLGTSAFGLSIFKPVDPSPGFTPGWCTMHVVQHQRNEYGIGGEYAFDVIIYDDAKKVIGSVQAAPIDANSKTLSVTSHLPYTVEVEAKGGDADPVVFKYGGQTWQSGDGTHQNTLGNGPENGYEYGDREGDMGFTC